MVRQYFCQMSNNLLCGIKREKVILELKTKRFVKKVKVIKIIVLREGEESILHFNIQFLGGLLILWAI